jgi:hypothetical protein
MSITWSQIEAECGDYRAGFVQTFRNYEGQPTDELDGAGRVVKVTSASFSRHMGIPRTTFDDWLARDGAGARRHLRTHEDRARQSITHLDSEDKARLAAELLADDEVAEHVVTDRQARTAVTRATDDYYQRQAVERTERTERMAAGDDTDRRVDALLWVNRLGEEAERWSRGGNEALRHIGALPESERYWLTGAIDRAEATTRAARRYLELGKSEFDAELESLLDSGS